MAKSAPQGAGHQFEARDRERAYIGEAVGVAGFQRAHPLGRSRDRETSVSGWIAITIAARPGGACFAKSPCGRELHLGAPRQQQRVRLGRGTKFRQRSVANGEQ